MIAALILAQLAVSDVRVPRTPKDAPPLRAVAPIALTPSFHRPTVAVPGAVLPLPVVPRPSARRLPLVVGAAVVGGVVCAVACGKSPRRRGERPAPPPVVVPEPATWALVAGGLVVLTCIVPLTRATRRSRA